MLYLHETIDIEGTGQEAYIEAVRQRAAHSEATGISRLVGCWRVIGSTGRWPQVVNLWEMDGWAHWADGLERQFLPERRDPHLGPWWAEAARHRRGGFDRILEARDGTPPQAAWAAAGTGALVVEQTIVTAPAGRSDDVVEALADVLLPLLRRRGFGPAGVYTAPMRSDEAVVLAALPSFADICRWYDTREADAGWCRWRRLRTDLRLRAESCWLVRPLP